MWGIIKRPLITEKNTIHSAESVYVFEVEKKAAKTEIAKAVESLFGVKVVRVNTTVCRNRQRKVGKNLSSIRYWKKAFVKVKAGQKISIFEGA